MPFFNKSKNLGGTGSKSHSLAPLNSSAKAAEKPNVLQRDSVDDAPTEKASLFSRFSNKSKSSVKSWSSQISRTLSSWSLNSRQSINVRARVVENLIIIGK